METVKKLDESVVFPEKLQQAENLAKYLINPLLGAVITFVTVFVLLFILNVFAQLFGNSSDGLIQKFDSVTAGIAALFIGTIKFLENFRK